MSSSTGYGYLQQAAANGRVFSAGSDPAQVGPNWIGTITFDALVPILVFRNPSDSAMRATLDSVLLTIANTPGGPVNVRVLADRVDRYTTLSGTLHENGAGNPYFTHPAPAGRGLESLLEVYDELPDYEPTSHTQDITYNGVTVTLTSADQDVDAGVVAASAGSFLKLDFRGSVIMEPGTSVAIYAWAATTAPQGRFSARWNEDVRED